MKHRTPALVLLIGLCLCLLASSFGSSASTAIQKSPADPAAASPQASSDDQDEQDNDADLPADLHGLDKENYLRRRAEYVGLRRGIEAGRPFDPEARGRAIEQMERQEQNLRLESMVSGTNLIIDSSRRFRSEEHTSEIQSLRHLVCRLLLEKKKI